MNEGSGVGINGVGVAGGTCVNDDTGVGIRGAGIAGMTVPAVFALPPPHAAIAADAASATMAGRYLMRIR